MTVELEVDWLNSDTDSKGYVEVELEWFRWVKKITKILKDSASLITTNQSLDGALEKLLTINASDRYHEIEWKETIESLIAVQKGIDEVQYRFTKLAASLNVSARTCLSLMKLNSDEDSADVGIVFGIFLNNLNQQALVELNETYEVSKETAKSLVKTQNLIHDKLKLHSREDALLQVLTRLTIGCGVFSFLVSTLQENSGFSFIKSLTSALIGAASIVFGLQLGSMRSHIVNTAFKHGSTTSSEDFFDNITCEAISSCSEMKTQLELVLKSRVPVAQKEKFVDGGRFFTDSLEKIEDFTRRYLVLSENIYGSLTDRHHCRNYQTF